MAPIALDYSFKAETIVALRVYGTLKSYSQDQVEVLPNAGLALGIPRSSYGRYDAGGAMIFIGSAEVNIAISQ